MKQLLLLLAATALLLAQQAGSAMPECGLGTDRDHPCHCMAHTNQVQAEALQSCIADRLAHSDDGPKAIDALCAQAVPEHCVIIEHYGNWNDGFDANGMHNNRMPNQCTRACTRSHCKCADGPTCHIMHDPSEDPKGRR
jgi:hypothetical protein